MYLNLKPYNTIKDEDLKSSRAGFFLLFVCFKASSPSPPSPPPSLSQVSSLWLSLSAFLSQRLFSRWLPSPLTSCWNIKSSNVFFQTISSFLLRSLKFWVQSFEFSDSWCTHEHFSSHHNIIRRWALLFCCGYCNTMSYSHSSTCHEFPIWRENNRCLDLTSPSL